MSRLDILKEGKFYSFDTYGEMPYEIDEILAAFGIDFVASKLALPRGVLSSDIVQSLNASILKNLEVVRISSKSARRQILVAPLLTEVTSLVEGQLRIEYGAVTSGSVWRFCYYDVTSQKIVQDLSQYCVPRHLQDVMEIMTGLLAANQPVTA